jgi:hypothetical protein
VNQHTTPKRQSDALPTPAVREQIAAELARWEAEHRTEAEAAVDRDRDEQGRFVQAPVTLEVGVRDDESAPGIRRRLLKRAKAGDEQAAELVALRVLPGPI